MSFEFRPAVRRNVPLVIGLAGSTGSGKTFSALRLAKGIAASERFCVIDTENGRALHYADQFAFDHGALEAPFTPARYAEAIRAADELGYPVIVVDSASHEHAGEGGLLDMHEDELSRIAGDDWRKREASTMGAWVAPKRQHKQFVSRLLQVRAHVILCFRAEEKVEMAKEKGRTVVRPKRSLVGLDGWIPVAEKNLPYELTINILMTADRPGVPKPIKIEQQHSLLVPVDTPLTEECGAALATWARGAAGEQETQIAALASDLLDCADRIGNRPAVMSAIQQKRRALARNPDALAAWLQAQLERAQAVVAEMPEAEVDWRDEAGEAA